jgi:hypothetical protein
MHNRSLDVSAVELLERAASHLGPVLRDAVFVGGTVIGLLVEGDIETRPTKDVDLIVPVEGAVEYELKIARQLRALGWREDTSDGAPRCRWVHDTAGVVDVMTPTSSGFGFENRWYAGAIAHAAPVELPGGQRVRVITLPYFLATKIVAFEGRGGGDFQSSHDIEDILTVVHGHSDVVHLVDAAPVEVRTFLIERVDAWLTPPSSFPSTFLNDFGVAELELHITAHFPSTFAGEDMATIALERLRAIAKLPA